jgi:FlaA1/EpsC-like NDP-sugar epimerase
MGKSGNPAILDKSVLLTGAGGSIGSALARAVLVSEPRLIVLLDQSERSLYEIASSLTSLRSSAALVAILGDIGDPELLGEIFDRRRPDVILHAAACKHVPLMERNPIAAVRTNAIGTNILAKTAANFGVANLIMISTDKAVSPRSIMGASKRAAELALLRWTSGRSCMRAIRLGNVLGSQGSVVRTFEQQISAGGPVTVTHPNASRYFLDMKRAVELILAVVSLNEEGHIFLSDLGEPVRILDLAHETIRKAGFQPGLEIPITWIGLRPGDKISENFVDECESVTPTCDPRLFAVKTPPIPEDEFDSLMNDLTAGVTRRDVSMVIESLCKLVPEYQPAVSLLQSFSDSVALQK